jgi:signal transduction histidine kinase
MISEPPPPVREALIASVPILIGRVDERGIIQETEGSLPNIATLEALEPGRTSLAELFPDDADEIRDALSSGTTRIEAHTISDGNPEYFELKIVADRKRGSGSYFLVHDVTEARLLQIALLDCADREQIRIGQELHDTLGQELFGIAYHLHALSEQTPAPLSLKVSRIAEQVSSSLRRARDIAFTMSPHPSGEDIGRAFRRLCAHMHGTFDIECEFTSTLEKPITDNGVAFQLFRIAQEACTNAVRHASPSRIEILLTTGRENRLEISDDGKGLDPAEPALPGMGMSMMKFRARAMGGSLRFLPRDPSGTIVRCRFENKCVPDGNLPADNTSSCPTCL